MKKNNRGFVDLGFAKLDIQRKARRGFPEIIYARGKSTGHLTKIVEEFRKHTPFLLISKLEAGIYETLKKYFSRLEYFPQAKIGFLGRPSKKKKGRCVIVTAGTSDIPIAQEAAIFLELTGNQVETIYDVGAAGAHRLKPFLGKLKKAKVIIVVAGMEAALLSLVSGMTKAPLIGVPTSAGYGASFKGLSALLGMINSCSLGSVVVNIDNGLGAGYFANLINK
jgi:NCAIR mutase (PurE)-related protein